MLLHFLFSCVAPTEITRSRMGCSVFISERFEQRKTNEGNHLELRVVNQARDISTKRPLFPRACWRSGFEAWDLACRIWDASSGLSYWYSLLSSAMKIGGPFEHGRCCLLRPRSRRCHMHGKCRATHCGFSHYPRFVFTSV